MPGADRIQQRFDELAAMADRVAASKEEKEVTEPLPMGMKSYDGSRYKKVTKYRIDGPMLTQWETSVRSLLHRVFGHHAPTYQRFLESAQQARYANVHAQFTALQAVFLSAKDEYEGGYLFDVRNLVHADVFSDELEQAQHWNNTGHKVPAAVIAGTVLESSLRELCDQHPNVTPADNINRMNDDLAKEAVYNKMRADQVRAWAKIRNSAAHGKPDEFEPSDVSRMIEGIRDFVADQMG